MQSPTSLLKTRRPPTITGSVLLHCVGDARFSNHLNVYHRPRIHPHNLGFAQRTQLSTIHHLRHLANGTGAHDVRENKNRARGVDVCMRFFKDARESCVGTFVDNLLSAAAVMTTSAVVSQRKTISPCSLVTNPDPELFFLKAVIVSVFERRSAPHEQRRAVASAFRSSTLVIFLS